MPGECPAFLVASYSRCLRRANASILVADLHERCVRAIHICWRLGREPLACADSAPGSRNVG